jgi:hypothetical protein
MSFFSRGIDKGSPFGLRKRKSAKPTEPLSCHFSEFFHAAASHCYYLLFKRGAKLRLNAVSMVSI